MSGPPGPLRAVKPPALPAIPLPRRTVTVGGVDVEFRSLSRSEALKVTTDFEDRADAAEIFILSRGVGITEEAAAKWRDETDPEEAGKVIDGIVILSGLADAPKEGEPDPKA